VVRFVSPEIVQLFVFGEFTEQVPATEVDPTLAVAVTEVIGGAPTGTVGAAHETRIAPEDGEVATPEI
jgi:hypothetical protein